MGRHRQTLKHDTDQNNPFHVLIYSLSDASCKGYRSISRRDWEMVRGCSQQRLPQFWFRFSSMSTSRNGCQIRQTGSPGAQVLADHDVVQQRLKKLTPSSGRAKRAVDGTDPGLNSCALIACGSYSPACNKISTDDRPNRCSNSSSPGPSFRSPSRDNRLVSCAKCASTLLASQTACASCFRRLAIEMRIASSLDPAPCGALDFRCAPISRTSSNPARVVRANSIGGLENRTMSSVASTSRSI